MAWVAVDEDGEERIFEAIPYRLYDSFWAPESVSSVVSLPKGSIKRLIGRDLSWSDEPVELKE